MKKSIVITLLLTMPLLLFLYLNTSPTQSATAASPSRQAQISSSHFPSIALLSGPTPIGPVTTLPGSSVTEVPPADTSLIGKAGGFNLAISGIVLDKYTSLFWGPASLSAIQHSLQGPLTIDRVMNFDPAPSNLANGIGYWLGSSPNIYQVSNIGTRFTLTTLGTSGIPFPLVLASSVNISNADVVMPVLAGDFNANLLFETNNSGISYSPSDDFFNNWANKSNSLDGSILSSFSSAFWYTAPDVDVKIQTNPPTVCLNGLAQITITVTDLGPGPATQILVTGPLPAGWQLESYSASPCGLAGCYDTSTGDWTVGSLTEGNQSTLTLNVKVVTDGLQLTETKTQYQVDPVASNDTATAGIGTSYCVYLPVIIR